MKPLLFILSIFLVPRIYARPSSSPSSTPSPVPSPTPIKLSWGSVDKYTDGTPITDVWYYLHISGNNPSCWITYVTPKTSFTWPPPELGKHTVYVTAVVGGVLESEHSNELKLNIVPGNVTTTTVLGPIP
jgi:hypothetical protein